MNQLYISLVVAFLSGLTWLAYKHDKGFKKVFLFLSGTMFIIAIAKMSYISGYHDALLELVESENDINFSVIDSLFRSKDIESYEMLLFLAGFAYLFFLRYFLPELIKDNDD